MFLKILLFFLLVELATSENNDGFIYNGFQGANVSLDGIAQITPNGLLKLTNTSEFQKGHAFYSFPIQFKNFTSNSSLSFSTSFVFAIVPEYPDMTGHGLAFAISPSESLPAALPGQYLGLFNLSDIGISSNHVVAVEFDTGLNPEFRDIDDNHVGIDVNSLNSMNASPAAYLTNDRVVNISLKSGDPIQVWVDYSAVHEQLNVTLSPGNLPKPSRPLLSTAMDLSHIILNSMYVGFSSSTGRLAASHYILGWSFKLNGQAEALDLSRLPALPRRTPKEESRFFIIGLPVISAVLIVATISVAVFVIIRKRKFAEIHEDWEDEYGPHKFSYKDLFIATDGFKDSKLMGRGGFGSVYRGVLPRTNMEIAVKRVSHESRQGMREFVAEIVTLGRLRHRNLVQLLGYCRRQGELLLVYDFMPNGSLDKFLFDEPEATLNWSQRFQVVKGVAAGLLYLHEEWEKIVLHRDIKASNILLDCELNGRLGDFGLARLYDHGTDPGTTHVVGTLGYISPELTRTGKATRNTDVFAFGAFMLEVACGRRPIELRALVEEPNLADWVLQCWRKGSISEARDPKLGTDYVTEEIELVLKIGLLCSHTVPDARPSMGQVMQFLDGDAPLPEISFDSFSSSALALGSNEGFTDIDMSYPSLENIFVNTSSSETATLHSLVH